jgi:predicted nucleotidyltransferase
MTKIDERSDVPRVDSAARRRLAIALDRPGVVSVRLFGSQATGKAGPLSDVDVAVWLDPARSDRDALQRGLMSAASESLGTDELQLVVLNDATPLLRHRALRDGILLLDRDPRMRIGLETAAIIEYLDTAPLRAATAAGVRHRIEEGRFGRR